VQGLVRNTTCCDPRMKNAVITPMQRYRNRLRAESLRPVQLWVPDTRSPRFVRAFRRQARLVAAHEAQVATAEARAIEALLAAQDTTGWVP
jgi:hypothetical protein